MDSATAIENFLVLNDSIKAMLLAMPPVTLFAFTALFLNHRRRVQAQAQPQASQTQPEHEITKWPLPEEERHAEMRDLLEEIRTRSSTLKNRN